MATTKKKPGAQPPAKSHRSTAAAPSSLAVLPAQSEGKSTGKAPAKQRKAPPAVLGGMAVAVPKEPKGKRGRPVKPVTDTRHIRILIAATDAEVAALDAIVHKQNATGGSLTSRPAVLWELIKKYGSNLLNNSQKTLSI